MMVAKIRREQQKKINYVILGSFKRYAWFGVYVAIMQISLGPFEIFKLCGHFQPNSYGIAIKWCSMINYARGTSMSIPDNNSLN